MRHSLIKYGKENQILVLEYNPDDIPNIDETT
jgi:hypothetical protein